MSEFRQLIDATITHLESLQAEGVRSVPVTRAALAELIAATVPVAQRTVSGGERGSTSRANATAPAPAAVAPTPAPKAVPSSVAARWSQSLTPTRPAPKAPLVSQTEAAPTGPPTIRPEPAIRMAAMEELRRRAMSCTRCPHLAATRRTVVVGVGNAAARLMFVGEAPGVEEDRRGEPFVGAAGELLTKIIGAMNLSREEVFIANVLKCRPDTPGQATGNRKPTPEEMATCLPWLEEQIGIVQPEVLVALGGTAVEGLLGKSVGIMRLRGTWQTYRGIPLMPTFHPAYVTRNETAAVKRQVWEDMLAVMERLGLPVSERQRGFYLPKK